jgi:putative ubiquitin-RnfH superfamily antitoxin RatB of RatAB toxin-antitoxin module
LIRIEVAYALPERQMIITLEVDVGCSVLAAVQQSGITRDFPDIDPASARYGIFGDPVQDPASHPVRAGDRVEIYRPLLIDPKAVRRQRADTNKNSRRQRPAIDNTPR